MDGYCTDGDASCGRTVRLFLFVEIGDHDAKPVLIAKNLVLIAQNLFLIIEHIGDAIAQAGKEETGNSRDEKAARKESNSKNDGQNAKDSEKSGPTFHGIPPIYAPWRRITTYGRGG